MSETETMKKLFLIRMTGYREGKGQTNNATDFVADSKKDFKILRFDTKEEAEKHIKANCLYHENIFFEIVEVYSPLTKMEIRKSSTLKL